MKKAWAMAFAIAIAGTTMSSIASADGDEKVVSIDQIPAPARASLVREAKGDPIVRVELENRKGKTTYEGVVKHGDDLIGINVDADGKVLGRHSEKNEKEEHK
jgi:hypothetical protein